MGVKTGISWCDSTWNPWQGCTKVSRGCENCYMYREKKRHGQDPTTVVRSKPKTFNLPLAKKRDGSWKIPSGSRVFVCSWSDFFHPDADEWRAEAFAIMGRRSDLFFLIPTKRPTRMVESLRALVADTVSKHCGTCDVCSWWNHLWPGVSIEDQEVADPRIEELLRLEWPGIVWASLEPLLGSVRVAKWLSRDVRLESHAPAGMVDARFKGLDWIVVGGESGPNARPMHPEWVRRIRDDCAEAGVPFHLKQWGEWAPMINPSELPDTGVQLAAAQGCWMMGRVGKKAAGCLLDGREWKEFPETL